ncbi:hypothetical protein [Bradyrhizobium niftali]
MRRHYDAFDPVVCRAIRDMRAFRWGPGLGATNTVTIGAPAI